MRPSAGRSKDGKAKCRIARPDRFLPEHEITGIKETICEVSVSCFHVCLALYIIVILSPSLSLAFLAPLNMLPHEEDTSVITWPFWLGLLSCIVGTLSYLVAFFLLKAWQYDYSGLYVLLPISHYLPLAKKHLLVYLAVLFDIFAWVVMFGWTILRSGV